MIVAQIVDNLDHVVEIPLVVAAVSREEDDKA
jgi:hypothetical protein